MKFFRIRNKSFIKWILIIVTAVCFYKDCMMFLQYRQTQVKPKLWKNTAPIDTKDKKDTPVKKTIKQLNTNIQTKEDKRDLTDLDKELSLRNQRLEKYCKTFKTYATKTTAEKQVYLSKKYNFTLCQVPKIGTTFLALAFDVIENNNYDLQVKSRQIIQGETLQFSVLLGSDASKEQRTIIASRDPYSRIFSAYIDKSYLPGTYYINKMMMNRKKRKFKVARKCIDLEFQDFLEFIIREDSRGEILDMHWLPVTTSCRPCEFKPFLVLKHETFERDIWYALKNIGVEKQELQGIGKLFQKWKQDLSVPVLVKAVNFTRDTECFSWIDTARRVWNALKMRGYMHKDEKFPLETLKTNNIIGNKNYFIELILETIKMRPLTSEEQKEQRRQALVDAYKFVKPDLVKSIQKIYKQDFEMFDYPPQPPS